MIVSPSTVPFAPDPQEPIAIYLELVAGVRPDAWLPLGDFSQLADGAAVEADSRMWMARLLRPTFDPYAREGVRRAMSPATDATFDFLRHSYRADGLALEVIESVQFVLVRVAPEAGFVAGADEAATASAIAELGDRVLVTAGTAPDAAGEPVPYTWDLVYEPPLRDGVRFSSAPDEDPLALPSWTTRLDGGIDRGVPFFLAHKVHTSGDGRIIALSGRHWFDGKCWQAYASVPRA